LFWFHLIPLTEQLLCIFSNESDAIVDVEVDDVLGQKVLTILNSSYFTKGEHQIDIDLGDYADGLYLLRVVVNGNMTVYQIIKK